MVNVPYSGFVDFQSATYLHCICNASAMHKKKRELQMLLALIRISIANKYFTRLNLINVFLGLGLAL